MATGPPGSMPVPPSDQQPSSSDPSWEGDRMFNIYIYDYCNKRGFRKTARELLAEAEIPPDSAPPINAKQGLLFEWWSVFWVLFTAKSNGAGTDDAMVYTQHQQANLRQGSRPLNHPIPQVNRMINGNPAPIPYPMVGGHQANGIPLPSAASTPAGANPAPPQNFNSLMPGQRPGAPQHRGPNGVNPYQSPTIAHSPQNPATNAGPNPQNPQSVMNQLGPSPHMAHMARAGMLPPNANMGPVPSTQTPPFSQLARSPSRPGSPGQSMMHPSPSLINRQTPVNPQESSLNSELSRLPTALVTTIKQELSYDKELQSLTFDEKNRIVTIARQRSQNQAVRKPGPPGPAGPSNLAPGMQLQGQRMPGQPQPPQLPLQQQVPQQQQSQQQQPPQQQQQRVVKRNSTSPGEEHGQLPNSESSPPDRKRVRRSSISEQAPPVPAYPHQPQQTPQQIMNGAMMRAGPMGPMGNFPPHGPPGMANPGMGIPMGAPQMQGNTMSPAMGGPRTANMQLQYHQGVHAMTKGLAMANLPGGGAGTPAPGEPPFNPGPGQPPFPGPGPQNNRMGQNKPMGMMPPPSPAGGPPKEQPKDVNKPPGPNGTEGSPRNQQPPNPVQQGSQVPQNPSGTAQVSTAPPTPSATNSSMTAASPSTVVNGTPTINPASQQPATTLPEVPAAFLTTEFMQSVASSLGDFEQGLFRNEDGGINFEEDFGEWFNHDGLDMK